MIKIELESAMKEKNIYLHKQYIKKYVLEKLEEYLNGKTKFTENPLYNQYCIFLKSLFSQSEQERAKRVLELCISDDLENLIENFENKFWDSFGFSFKNPKSEGQKKIVKEIKELFDVILDYAKFNTGRKVEGADGKNSLWNRHVYVINTGVKVCPYCNRQYITSYSSEDKTGKTTADVDHYYPQSLYPYLQMNLYNMVPSCNICNSKTKGFKDKRHLNPYQDGTDSLLFEIPLDDVKTLYSSDVEKIIVNTRGNPKAVASNEVFKLDRIYQTHTSDIKRLLYNFKEYEAFRENYYKKTMGIDMRNIFSLWFDFLDINPLEEPLVKLKQDIYKQLSNGRESA